MTPETVAPVRKQIVVNASQEHVFKVFTRDINTWWPREHHIGTSPLAQAMLEPHAGGRWYAICEDGSECDTGKVLAWDPPRRLVLAWQITAQWQFDPEFVTEVEVNFVADGPKTTTVTLEHRNLARYGVAAEAFRASIDAAGGWGKLLESLARRAEEAAP
ncbi:MAG: SRPBCC family protein [bacterium]